MRFSPSFSLFISFVVSKVPSTSPLSCLECNHQTSRNLSSEPTQRLNTTRISKPNATHKKKNGRTIKNLGWEWFRYSLGWHGVVWLVVMSEWLVGCTPGLGVPVIFGPPTRQCWSVKLMLSQATDMRTDAGTKRGKQGRSILI